MGGLAKIGARQLAPEGEPMQATRSVVVSDERAVEAAPGPLPKPPGRPPAEPIIIRTPPRQREDLEIERPDDMDEDKSSEIRRPPPWVPRRA
jgi:hypothetical protein